MKCRDSKVRFYIFSSVVHTVHPLLSPKVKQLPLIHMTPMKHRRCQSRKMTFVYG